MTAETRKINYFMHLLRIYLKGNEDAIRILNCFNRGLITMDEAVFELGKEMKRQRDVADGFIDTPEKNA